MLPARLPMLLLNGASGIAVGMATEIPPHNLSEVAQAAVAMIREPDLSARRRDEAHQGARLPGRRPDHHAARGAQGGLSGGPRLGPRARALDGRAARARAVAAGGHRAAARHLGEEGAGGDRRPQQPAAEARQEVAHAGADPREAARALDARERRAQRSRRVRPHAPGAAGVRAAHREGRRGRVREPPAREDEPGDERPDQPGDGGPRRPSRRAEPAGHRRRVAEVPVRDGHAADPGTGSKRSSTGSTSSKGG